MEQLLATCPQLFRSHKRPAIQVRTASETRHVRDQPARQPVRRQRQRQCIERQCENGSARLRSSLTDARLSHTNRIRFWGYSVVTSPCRRVSSLLSTPSRQLVPPQLERDHVRRAEASRQRIEVAHLLRRHEELLLHADLVDDDRKDRAKLRVCSKKLILARCLSNRDSDDASCAGAFYARQIPAQPTKLLFVLVERGLKLWRDAGIGLRRRKGCNLRGMDRKERVDFVTGVYRYAQIERGLALTLGADERTQKGPLRGRLKKLSTLGLPASGPGKGARRLYSWEEANQLLLVLLMGGCWARPGRGGGRHQDHLADLGAQCKAGHRRRNRGQSDDAAYAIADLHWVVE
jgi:hypothetical protein